MLNSNYASRHFSCLLSGNNNSFVGPNLLKSTSFLTQSLHAVPVTRRQKDLSFVAFFTPARKFVLFRKFDTTSLFFDSLIFCSVYKRDNLRFVCSFSFLYFPFCYLLLYLLIIILSSPMCKLHQKCVLFTNNLGFFILTINSVFFLLLSTTLSNYPFGFSPGIAINFVYEAYIVNCVYFLT